MSHEIASQPQVKTVWLIGILAAFAIFMLIAGYSSRMTNDYPDYDQQRAQQRYETLKKVQSAEDALLTPRDAQGNPTAEWVDQTKGVIRIPIQEAMAREVEALKSQQAGVGSPLVAPPPPATSVAPASTGGASTNAPASAKPKEEKK